MAKPFLIIDGYNLMHAAGMTRQRYGPGDLERQRNWFLRFVGHRLNASERQRTIVVFDAGNAPVNVPRLFDEQGMQILFAEPGGDADSLIEQLVAEHSAPRQILLVSSDHRLQTAVRRRRGRSVDSEVFAARLEEREATPNGGDDAEPPVVAPDPKFGGEVSDAETEEWLAIFGETPAAGSKGTETVDLEQMLDRLPENLEDLLDDDETP